jgi:hypothetical protein
VGASASVVRAAIMASLALVAQRIGRRGGLNTLAAAVVLQGLEGRAILRTNLNGALTLYTDGEQLWVETER